MKGDFTRDTFKPDKHYQQVLMQQGRVQLDADWNEQSAIAARRDETTAADLIGGCGGPAENAAFAIITAPAELTHLPADADAPIRQFALSQGRYYVDGIQCEVESPFLFSWQPDHRETSGLSEGDYLLYLDVWQRHVTMYEDGGIREAALGGPDTATRVKTVWQVRAAALDAPLDPDNPPLDPCHQSADEFDQRQRLALPQLAAKTTDATPDDDPCTVPASAGYRGLENQLYRVEIHQPGYLGKATYKWSRENGAVVTRITSSVEVAVNGVNVNQLTVDSTGPDDNLGFKRENLVEIIHDSEELEGIPGKLARVAEVDNATGKITLAKFGDDTMPLEIDLQSNPRLRRWDGFGVVDVDVTTNDGFLELENGVEVCFKLSRSATCRTGDYWQIPARTGSPDAQSGQIDWPATELPGGKDPEFLPPKGIVHHYCRLGVVSVDKFGAVTPVSDCRCLWPALTVPRMFYVSGDGQEVAPEPNAARAESRFRLPRPLIVGVANAHCRELTTSVRFAVVNSGDSLSNGFVAPLRIPPTQNSVIIPLDTDGLAKCHFYLDGQNTSQQVTARLLDATDNPVSLPVIFTANLSIASHVAYQPADCAGLADIKTVQDAIDRLARLASIYKVSGDGQQGSAGGTLTRPLSVLVANRCGPVANMAVSFNVVLGGGSVESQSGQTDANGNATCQWKLGGDSALQVMEAEVAGDNTTEPRKVHFIAHLEGEGTNDPAPVHIVELRYGDPHKVLTNDQTLRPSDLEAGLFLVCDQSIDPNTVVDPISSTAALIRRGQPTCFLTVEVPHGPDQDLQGIAFYESIILHGQVRVTEWSGSVPNGVISWQTSGAPLQFLSRVFSRLKQERSQLDKILARLTLKGNFIWSAAAKELVPKLGGFLDGEVFRSPGDSELLLPSGDNRRGGDFEMWFWLQPEPSFSVKPDVVNFGDVTKDQTEQRGVSLINGGDNPVSATVKVSGDKVFSLSRPSEGTEITVGPHDQLPIVLLFKPTQTRSFTGNLEISTTNSQIPSISIKLSGTSGFQ